MVNSKNENDAKILQYQIMQDASEIGKVSYEDLQMKMIHVLRKNGKATFKREGMDRYFTTQFYQSVEDWDDLDNPITYHKYPSKVCE